MPSRQVNHPLQLVVQFYGPPTFLAGTCLECTVGVRGTGSVNDPPFTVTGLIGHVVGQFKLEEKVSSRLANMPISKFTSPLDEIGTPASPMYFDAGSLLMSTLSPGTSLLYSAPMAASVNRNADGESSKSSFHLSLQLPASLPPSVRGCLFKVAYKLLVAVRVYSVAVDSAATALLQVPIRVLPIGPLVVPPSLATESTLPAVKVNPFWRSTNHGEANSKLRRSAATFRSSLTASSVRTALLVATSTGSTGATDDDKLSPTGTDDRQSGSPDPGIHRINQWIESTAAHVNAAGQAANFNISCQYGSVARLYLMRTVFRLGDPVRGYFDFANASVACLRFHLSLQSTESCLHSTHLIAAETMPSLGPEFANPAFVVVPASVPPSGGPGDAPGNGQDYDQLVSPITNTHEEQEYVCPSHLFMPFSLPIPATLLPEFCARCRILPGLVVDYRWHLRIAFDLVPDAAGADQNLTGSRQPGQTWSLPSDVAVQRLTWSLPIKLLSSNPNVLPPSSGSVFTQLIQSWL